MEYYSIPLSQPRGRYDPRTFKFYLTDPRLADLGKVLAGIQVPPNESAEFDGFLDKLGYPFVEETENAVYKRYLRG